MCGLMNPDLFEKVLLGESAMARKFHSYAFLRYSTQAGETVEFVLRRFIAETRLQQQGSKKTKVSSAIEGQEAESLNLSAIKFSSYNLRNGARLLTSYVVDSTAEYGASSPVVKPFKTQIKIIGENEAGALRSRITEAYAKILSYPSAPRIAVYRVDPAFIVVLDWEGVRQPQLKLTEMYIRSLQRELGGLQKNGNGNIFFSIPLSFSNEPLSVFSRGMIRCMIDQRDSLKGATVVDFGAGEGILCRIALGLGSLRVYGFDRSPEYISCAKWISFLEGWIKNLNHESTYSN